MSQSTKDASSIGPLIDEVTARSYEDWPTIMQICDIVNSSADGPKEAAKGIRKHFAANDPSVIKLTLALLDTCVKNCGLRFHIQVAQRDFLQDFLKIIKPKNSPSAELQMNVLGQLQSWAFAFQGFPELTEVNKLYQELKSKNVEFPPIEQNNSAKVNIAVQDTSGSAKPPSGKAGASYLIVPQSNNAHARLSPSGGRRVQPPKSPIAPRRHSKEGLEGASYLIVPPSSNAFARLSPSGQRKNKQPPSPSGERKPLTTDALGEPIKEGTYSSGASYLIVPHTSDAYARLSPSGTRRNKAPPTPSGERRPSKTDAYGGESSLISYERLSSSDASLQEATPSPSSDRKPRQH